MPLRRPSVSEKPGERLRADFSAFVLATGIESVADGRSTNGGSSVRFQIGVGPVFRLLGTYPTAIGIVRGYT